MTLHGTNPGLVIGAAELNTVHSMEWRVEAVSNFIEQLRPGLRFSFGNIGEVSIPEDVDQKLLQPPVAAIPVETQEYGNGRMFIREPTKRQKIERRLGRGAWQDVDIETRNIRRAQ